MSPRVIRRCAVAGGLGALVSIGTLAVSAGPIADTVTDGLLIVGLAGFAGCGAARGWLARVGLSLAFAGLAVFAVADATGAGETLHPISVPLTGVGMLLTGIATLRTGRWHGWQRFAPLLCGIVPFAVELPGFIVFGDSGTLYFFIAATWTAWLILFGALWTRSRPLTAAAVEVAV